MVTPRQFVAAIGILLAAVGIVFLMLPMQASETDSLFGSEITVECGSAVATSTGAPSAACDDKIGTRRAWAIALLAVGAVAVIGAYVVASPAMRAEGRRQSPTTPEL